MRIWIVIFSFCLAACGSNPASVSGPTPAGFYRVKSGDTLYRIAKNNDQSVAELQRWNRLSKSDDIQVGQLLRLTPPAGSTATAKPSPTQSSRPSLPVVNPPSSVGIEMVWPAQGPLLYSYAPPRVKGIGIGGNLGAPIVAVADGKVLYSGDGIRGYGLLLIIQHAQGYLTAYAHNQKLLVKEGAQVKQGQAIATMGKTGTDSVKLHFEVRYKGKTINPVSALPSR
ncbi:peptidoglycan DD-metalloendopeptidase family protein [Deefgea sp. CFH1-16]|uniref:peptidoglycan DD-metalloendopeptidase family protein n=1 Tax=Deefgea sp. CFH1-16 TaxID=2675457 RepID=UPI0015F37266|nr:peptidoglycan DD-metalloendopeptidase family protein [Deefgea sp. CFH1-16]MBM5575016.1 peptidoglycan DD-metalloendopeptidase family protein [Deefgea sp. CFH1-16]